MSRKSSVVALLVAAFPILLLPRATRNEQTTSPPEIIILKGSPLGGVLLAHRVHGENYAGGRCEVCHHPSRPEKPATAPQQACRSCHVKPPQPPMKTGTQAAFHNPAATAGTCIDCHLRMNATGKKAPTACLQCHKRENG